MFIIKKLLKHLSESKKKATVIKKVIGGNLTYLDKDALSNIYCSIRVLEENSIEGIFIEAGCALGGSSIIIASAKKRNRVLYTYDVFGQIPPPTINDGDDVKKRYNIIKQGKSKGLGDDIYYGYQENLLEVVKENFKKFKLNVSENNIRLIQGLYQETLHINQPIAFAHIDCDWYDSVMTCLNEIVPNLVQKGIIIIDDYNTWSGCKKAVDEYFKDKFEEFEFIKKCRLIIKKR